MWEDHRSLVREVVLIGTFFSDSQIKTHRPTTLIISFPFSGRDFFPNYLFIYVAVSDLCCSMQTLSCGMWDLVPGAGIRPGPPSLGAWSLSHWTTREVPRKESWKRNIERKKTDQEEEEPGKRGRAFLLCRHQTLTQAARATHTLAHFALTSAIVYSFHSDLEEWVPPKMTRATTPHRVLSWARPLTTWPQWPVPCFLGVLYKPDAWWGVKSEGGC